MKTDTFSIPGKFHKNEDSLLVEKLGIEGIVAVLADGMGGLSLGDIAASIVTKAIVDYIRSHYQESDERNILRQALEYADNELRISSISNKSNMGAAVAVVVISNNCLYYTWQGNVRVYLIRESICSLITQDHIADIGYGRTALTRRLRGSGLRDDVPFCSCNLENGDYVLLCTDGLYDINDVDMGNFSIYEIINQVGSPADDASFIRISIY